jgi:hypothetical protein
VRILVAVALALAVAACAPATTVERFEPSEGARAFTLTVDGAPAVRDGAVYRIRGDDFDITATLEHDRVLLDVVNNTDGMLLLHTDRSTFVLTDGTVSRVVTGATSWNTRDDQLPPIEIPAGQMGSVTLIPRDHLRWDDGLVIEPLFPWPLTERAALQVALDVEVPSGTSEVVLQFTGTPD